MADPNESLAPDTGADAGADAGGAAEPSLRDALDDAFTEASNEDPPGAAAPGGPARDASGRFRPAEAPAGPLDATKPAPQGVTGPAPRPGLAGAPPDGAAPPAPELKAPAQWKPEARERWAGADPLIKAEVNRREREFQTHLQQSAGLRDFVSAFENIVRPYEMFIRAENSNPLSAVANLFDTAAQLRVGTPQTKAMMVAGLCQQYAIDMQQLDTALAQVFGVATEGANPAAVQQMQQRAGPQTFQDPRVDQYLYWMAQQQQQQGEAETAEIQRATAHFAEGAEFFEDVRMEMADLIEIAARRGIVLPVKEAYDKACAMHPEISKIVTQRQSATNPRAMTQAALRARRAASSVKGESSPHGQTGSTGETLRGAIEAAMEQTPGNSRL
jgi:hypothetical protein